MSKKPFNAVLPGWLRSGFINLLDPAVVLATRWGVHPNIFTTISLLLSGLASYFIAVGSIRLAAALLLISGMCDVFDGSLARHSGKVTKFGALYDSALDRYSEVLFFFGTAYYFIRSGWYLTSVAVAVGLGGSLMVSYVRARAEGLGFECSVGLLQRPERIVLLGLGGLVHLYTFVGSIWIIAVLSNVTAIQRIVYVWKIDQGNPRKADS